MKPRLIWIAAAFALGVGVGGYLFSKSIARSFLAVHDCRSACYRPNDLAGLLVSAGILRTPGLIPTVVKETDKCIAIKHPFGDEPFHFVVFPKKDVKNIAEITLDDQPYVMDCFAVLAALAAENGLRRYAVLTNGPGMQDVTYLHFHLTSWEQPK